MKHLKLFKLKKIYLIAIILGLISLLIFTPFIRNFFIYILEQIRGRQINHNNWNHKFIIYEIYFLIFDIAFILFYKFKPFPHFSKNITKEIINYKISKNSFLLILLSFIFTLGIRIYFISQKKSFHVDEVLSISICNRNEYGYWRKMFLSNKEYTGKEVKEISLFDNDSITDVLDDIYNLHIDNSDSPHTNFYYSLLRICFSGCKTSNINYIIWRACILNLLFFSISFIFLFLLLKEFCSKDNYIYIIPLCLIIAFANPNSISLTLFIRPYELQQTLVIIITYFVIKCMNDFILFKDNKLLNNDNCPVTTIKMFTIGIVSLAFTLLSGYFNFILIGFFGLSIIILSIRKKDLNFSLFFIYMFIFSIILAKIIYLKFGDGFKGNRGEEAFDKIHLSFFVMNFTECIKGLNDIFFKNNIFLIIFVLLTVLYFVTYFIFNKNNMNFNYTKCSIIISTIVTILFTYWFAPYKTSRYIASFLPILVIIFTTKSKQNKLVLSILLLLACSMSLSLIPLKSKNTVEHIDDANLSEFEELQTAHKNIIIQNAINWRLTSLLPYLPDDISIYFIDSADVLMDQIPSEDVFYIYQNSNTIASKRIEDINIKYEQRKSIGDYSIYYIPKQN